MGKQGWREMWLKRRKRRFLISCEELQEQNLKQKIMLKYGSRDFFFISHVYITSCERYGMNHNTQKKNMENSVLQSPQWIQLKKREKPRQVMSTEHRMTPSNTFF